MIGRLGISLALMWVLENFVLFKLDVHYMTKSVVINKGQQWNMFVNDSKLLL